MRLWQWFGGRAEQSVVVCVPSGMRLYAVGDIHGRHDLLTNLQSKITADAAGKNHTEIYLGDYIDRGPHSRQVIDRLLENHTRAKQRIFLKGNHEQALLNFLQDASGFSSWQNFGGLETLKSYGVKLELLRKKNGVERVQKELSKSLPPEHLAFFQNLQLSASIGDYFFVHAGVRPGVSLDEQSEEDLIWIRDQFLQSRADHGKFIVHGHTRVNAPELLPNRINIDTGAYRTNVLSCLVLDGTQRRILQSS